MINEEKRIMPENMTIKEASEFWDTHSFADYSSQIVEIEYAPDDQIALVPIPKELLATVAKKAKQEGLSVQEVESRK